MIRITVVCLVISLGWAASSAAQPTMPERRAIHQACLADMQRYCADLKRKRLRQCMMQHFPALSKPCHAALAAAHVDLERRRAR